MRRFSFWNVLWGLMFIAGACLVVLHLFGGLGDFNTWTLLLSIPLAVGIVACAVKRSWGGIFFLLAALAFIYREYIEDALGIELSVGVLLGIATLLTIGFHLIFGSSNKWKYNKYIKTNIDFGGGHHITTGAGKEPDIENATGEKIFFSESFTGTSKYIKSDNLSYVGIDNSFGGMEVYFENAVLAPEGALVEIDNKFGGVELYIPRTWNIATDLSNIFAGSEEPNVEWIDGAPTITLRGTNKFGGIEVHRV